MNGDVKVNLDAIGELMGNSVIIMREGRMSIIGRVVGFDYVGVLVSNINGPEDSRSFIPYSQISEIQDLSPSSEFGDKKDKALKENSRLSSMCYDSDD